MPFCCRHLKHLPPPTTNNNRNLHPQSRRPLADLLDGFVDVRRADSGGAGAGAGGFVQLADSHLLQVNVSGGRNYLEPGGGGSTSDAAAAAAAAAAPPGGRMLTGADADARLRARWKDAAARAAAARGAREEGACVSLKFFGSNRVWVPRALVDAPRDEVAIQWRRSGGARRRQHTHEAAAAAAEARAGAGAAGGCGASGSGCGNGGSSSSDEAADDDLEPPPIKPAPVLEDDASGRAPGRVRAAYFTFDELCGAERLARAPPPLEATGGASSASSGSGGGDAGGSGGGGGGSGSGGNGGGGPLTAIDCLALAESGLEALYLEGVPRLRPGARGAAMRLVTLVDVLHDHGTEREHGSRGAAPHIAVETSSFVLSCLYNHPASLALQITLSPRADVNTPPHINIQQSTSPPRRPQASSSGRCSRRRSSAASAAALAAAAAATAAMAATAATAAAATPSARCWPRRCSCCSARRRGSPSWRAPRERA